MPQKREHICESASRKLLAAAPSLGSTSAVVGLDGFVDEIIAVVDKRHDSQRYDPVPTIAAFAEKIQRAVGQSSNYELVARQIKLGGNGPIMANALASMGLTVTYIGNLGVPELHPVFKEFAGRANVISVAEPGHTDALEFDDGKLMLGKYQMLDEITWEALLKCVGREQINQLVANAALIGLVNWTMIPAMGEIWMRLAEEVLRQFPDGRRKLFIDLADPEKRTVADITKALRQLSELQKSVDVILGLNLKESMEIAAVLNIAQPADQEAAIRETAAAIREKIQIGCVVIHPRRGAAAATARESVQFAGPFVQQPKISTGAGDHFNAGFCLGRVLGMSLEECLCVGVATSGYYVRSAASPTAVELAGFISELPPPQK